MKKLVLLAVFATALISAAYAIEATVVSTKGKAEVQDGATWKALANGDVLQKGAVIQTGFKSELVLKIKESTVTVEPLSRLTIEQLSEKGSKDDTRVFLDTGSLKANVKKVENRRVGFTVKSPVATASVRGTELGAAIGYQSTNIETYSGSVAVWSSNHEGAEIEPDEEEVAPPVGEEVAAGEDAAGEDAGARDEARGGEEISAAPATTPETVSDGEAPRDAFLVSAGQTAGFAENAAPERPQTRAATSSVSLGGGTRSAAAGEAVAMGGAQGNTPAAVDPVMDKPIASTGRVIIDMQFPVND